MNAKELQEQYLKDRQKANKPNATKVGDTLPNGYLDHVRNQYSRLAEHLGHDAGIDYVKDALKDYPDILAEELKSLTG